MNHKNYALREMLVDKCLQNGRAMTGREIMDFVNRYLEENGFEITSAEFTRIPTDLKDVTDEQRETIDKMVEKLEDFDDVQTVYTNMKPEEVAE